MNELFFEGPEKKVELWMTSGGPDLRALGRSFWQNIVEKARAQILSGVYNDSCDAYLLSESSLFVYRDRFIMITCGRTTLVEAVIEFLKTVSIDHVAMLIYERKNPHFPEYQPSNFYDDARVLKEMMPGRAFRYGEEDEHHVFMFHLDRPFTPSHDDVTLEVLMHNIQGDAQQLFGPGGPSSAEALRLRSGVTEIFPGIFPGYQIDDHIFAPVGYSLNAINGTSYYTVHVTPESTGSYVSFETNHRLTTKTLGPTIERVLTIFKPDSCDIILFAPSDFKAEIRLDYRLRRTISHSAAHGYSVRFLSYFQPDSVAIAAEEIQI